MSGVVVFLAGDAALLVLGVAGALAARGHMGRPIVYWGALLACAAMLIAAVMRLPRGFGPEMTVLPLGLPWIGAHFRVDSLSTFFLAVVNLGGCAASLFGLGSGGLEKSPERVLPFFPAFLAGMNLVVVADDAFTFLLSWEFMSIVSWALVMAHHRDYENERAGYVYILTASFGTAMLLLAFALLAGPAGGYAFDAMRGAGASEALRDLAFALALIGAGSKAGLVPLHVWLPLAHPAAPSHVSALMSGVMTKVAVYGFIRVAFDLAGPGAWWWSVPVLVAGAMTALLGVLYALMQHDLKRLLAYHTVENIGIVFIGLGLALAFKPFAMPSVAALAMTAGLLHALNHLLFKSLLFFGAGAALTVTGERDMERLGGLIHPMPVTAFAFLVGCVAISALPPLNGFISEWLTFQAILLSPDLPSWVLKILTPAVGAVLALSAALAAACFAKAFGITFLGRPRSDATKRAREVDAFTLTAMLAFAALCLIIGILPGFFIDALSPAVSAVIGGRMSPQAGNPWLSIAPIAASRSSYNGLLVFLFIAVSASLAASFIHRFASNALRRAPPWDCGFADLGPATQYSAESFAQPIRRVFGPVAYLIRERVEMPAPGDLRPARLELTMDDRAWRALHDPIVGIVEAVSLRLNRLQFLTIRQYLSVVFGALVTLLVVLASWP